MAELRAATACLAMTLGAAACTPAQQAVVDAALAQGEAGIKAAHDREAVALKQAPCAMSVGGYVRVLTAAEQGAVLTLCGGEQGISFEDLADMGRTIRLLQGVAGGDPGEAAE
jgi:hypothetical protein